MPDSLPETQRPCPSAAVLTLSAQAHNALQAVSVHGFKWSQVAKLVAGRSEVQCRDRFLNVLDPARKSGHWTAV